MDSNSSISLLAVGDSHTAGSIALSTRARQNTIRRTSTSNLFRAADGMLSPARSRNAATACNRLPGVGRPVYVACFFYHCYVATKIVYLPICVGRPDSKDNDPASFGLVCRAISFFSNESAWLILTIAPALGRSRALGCFCVIHTCTCGSHRAVRVWRSKMRSRCGSVPMWLAMLRGRVH